MLENLFSFLFPAALILAISYLIFKRIKEKKKEDFEDRAN